MWLYRMIGSQLAHPHGLIGRLLTSRILVRGNASLNRWTRQALDIQADQRVIDIGCGPGATVKLIASLDPIRLVVGIDSAALMIRQAAHHNQRRIAAGTVAFQRADAAALGYQAASFEKALAVNVVYFWPDIPKVFQEIQRILTPGGQFALGIRPLDILESLKFRDLGFQVHTNAEIQAMLEAAGFENVQILEEPNPPGLPGICMLGTKPQGHGL